LGLTIAGSDGGGLRRQYLGELQEELVNRLKLFIKTPNNIHSVGDERDRVCPNPKANSLSDRGNYFKLGVIYGLSLMLFDSLPIDVPSVFWKYLLNSSESNFGNGLEWQDIQKINLNQYNCLEKIKGLSSEELSYLGQKFTTYLLDGKEIELFPGGSKVELNSSNRLEYIELCKQIHLNELLKAFKQMARGWRKFIPSFLYYLITPSQLESGIVGVKGVDCLLTIR
jgi:HECT-domain (ubiquitin-transferase)